MSGQVLTVSQLNKYIKEIFLSDTVLSNVFVKGEISNFKHHHSGHMYFTLKDKDASIRVIMFRGNNFRLRFIPKDGMAVIVEGYISLYEKTGDNQLYAREMQPDGIGALHMAYQQLKERLEKEGLFDKANKLPIPQYPEKIVVMTSPTGSVIRDIINVISRRYPKISIMVVPIPVQGIGAGVEIANALKWVNRSIECDVILLCRGGGSLEDLWPFNEEVVARAIFDSKIPVVSGIGHETDFTISDFAADLRAPTPSAAAEIIVPDIREIYDRIGYLKRMLLKGIDRQVEYNKDKLNSIQKSWVFLRSNEIIKGRIQHLDHSTSSLIKEIKIIISKYKSLLLPKIESLNTLSPLNVLARGYSITYNTKGEAVKEISQANVGELIKILLNNGKLHCRVTGKEEK